ncbi:siderophore-interacting protein [Curtobacterium sp. RRHDQ10]|uniref:siderophore-interacting protein n=1 Tax=Curtobacterium phyllosphaerae TaxID=3413379 RepID=UPI003BF18553
MGHTASATSAETTGKASGTTSAETTGAISPFALQHVTVARVEVLSPTYRRVTFTGPDVRHCADNRYDQRIKLLFPQPGGDLAAMPMHGDWYAGWRALPDDVRPFLRTYTIREVRADRGEFDVDVALHGRIGPASAWAMDATVGDGVVVCVPDARASVSGGGVDWHAPASADRVLLAGDETALPAIAGILEMLPAETVGTAIVEVPDAEDAAALGTHPDGVQVVVLARGAAAVGTLLRPAVERAAGAAVHAARSAGTVLDDVDVDHELLWEVPDAVASDGARVPLYAWLAGEAGVIKLLRRHLVSTLGVDRRAVAFMGYWRAGQPERN